MHSETTSSSRNSPPADPPSVPSPPPPPALSPPGGGSPDRGARRWILGLLAAALLLPLGGVGLVTAGLLRDALRAARQSDGCRANLEALRTALWRYRAEHGQRFPDGISALTPVLSDTAVLRCPVDPESSHPGDWPLAMARASYRLPGWVGADTHDPLRVLVRCPFHDNVLMADGAVLQPDRHRRIDPVRVRWAKAELLDQRAPRTGNPGIR